MIDQGRDSSDRMSDRGVSVVQVGCGEGFVEDVMEGWRELLGEVSRQRLERVAVGLLTGLSLARVHGLEAVPVEWLEGVLALNGMGLRTGGKSGEDGKEEGGCEV